MSVLPCAAHTTPSHLTTRRYELAYHDWTQIKICGCTRFNMTRTAAGGIDGVNGGIKDAFTTKCPYAEDAGETFLINMREVVDSRTPGSFKEYAFCNKWDNKVRHAALFL